MSSFQELADVLAQMRQDDYKRITNLLHDLERLDAQEAQLTREAELVIRGYREDLEQRLKPLQDKRQAITDALTLWCKSERIAGRPPRLQTPAGTIRLVTRDSWEVPHPKQLINWLVAQKQWEHLKFDLRVSALSSLSSAVRSIHGVKRKTAEHFSYTTANTTGGRK